MLLRIPTAQGLKASYRHKDKIFHTRLRMQHNFSPPTTFQRMLFTCMYQNA